MCSVILVDIQPRLYTACNIEGKQLLVGGGERADVLPLRGSRVLCVPHSLRDDVTTS